MLMAAMHTANKIRVFCAALVTGGTLIGEILKPERGGIQCWRNATQLARMIEAL
jgi:hypothetical protein